MVKIYKIMRTSTYPIESSILNRHSPRALSGEPVTEQELLTLFEAARWAPSAYNAQPWRFVYAHQGTSHWQPLFDLLVEFNQGWVRHASALIVITAQSVFEQTGKPNPTHAFDTGAAWENLALQAQALGLVAHGMAGFNYEKAAEVISLPQDSVVLAMVAIGRPGKVEDLPESLREAEQLTDRMPLMQIVHEGAFPHVDDPKAA